MSYARTTAGIVIKIMNHFSTASGVFGTVMDYYMQAVCNSANDWVTYTDTRDANYGSNRRRMQAVADSPVDSEFQYQAGIIENRMKVPTDVYNFMKTFSETVSPTLTDLKDTWDLVESELEDSFTAIEDVIEAFAPFDELFEILGNFDCSNIPVLSIGKKSRSVIVV